MKSLLTLVLIANVWFTISAQISVTNATFPRVGDVLRYLVLEESPNINVGTPGENQTWNFNNLTGGTINNESYLDKSEGTKQAEFPAANLLIKYTGNPSEFYANALNNRIELVGFSGPDPLFGGEILINYNKRPQLRRSPMFYETTSRSEGEFRIQLSSSVIPDTILSQLPIRPDSIRIQINSVSNDTIDAWGKLNLSNKTYDVLREKSYAISETKVFLKIPFLGWIDLGMILGGGGLPEGIDGFLGADTTITYNFYTNTIKEILVSVDTDNNGNILGATYANTSTVSTQDEKLISSVKTYPNPASDFIIIEWKDGVKETVRINLVDVSGKIVKSGLFEPSPVMQLDVSNLARGSYLLRIENLTGRELFTSKAVLH